MLTDLSQAPLFIPKKQAAHLMGVSISVLDQMIQRGDIATRMMGRRRYVVTDSIRRLASAEADEPATPSMPREVRVGRA